MKLGGVTAADLQALMQSVANQAADEIGRLSTRISAVYSVLQLAIFIPILRYMGRKDRTFLMNDRPRPTDLLSAAAISAGLVGLTTLLFLALQSLANVVPYVQQQISDYQNLSQAFSGDGDVLWILLATCLVVPIAEEVIFRGIILNEFRRVMPVWAAVLLQGVLFSLFHMNFVQSTYVLIPGLLLGAVYAWTRSLAVPIVLHVAFNFFGAGLPAILGDSDAAVIAMIVEIAFIVVGGLCAVWLYLNRKKEQKPQEVP